MKKKMVTLLLAACLGCGVLAGCGSTSDTGSGAASTEAASAETEDPAHIIVTWVYYTSAAPDMQEVTDAVNEITIPEINVEVEFMPMSVGDTFSKYSTYIASGERIDMMLLLFQDPLQYYNNGSIEPLNDLLEGTTISELAETYPILATVDDEIYGFAPVDQYYGSEGCVYLKGDYADVCGDLISDDADHVYTMDELTQIFAAIKAEYPDVYPYNTVGNAISSTTLNFYFTSGCIYDDCGGGAYNGVLMGTDSKEMVNLFETDEYYNYLKTVKEWYDAGYILPDAAQTDSTNLDLLNSGVTCTELSDYNPIVYSDAMSNLGENAVPLKTTLPYYQSTAAGSVTWTVPVTAEEPEAAIKFMDLLYSNSDLENLVMWGIEGKHYVKTDVEQVIAFPEGVDGSTSGYYNTFGVWGDRRNQYVWMEAATKEYNEEYTEAAQANSTVAGIGNYQYDSTNMTSKIASIQAVMDQYLPALECGSASDLDATYQDFLAALKTAGIDDVIADNQAQFDEYLKIIE